MTTKKERTKKEWEPDIHIPDIYEYQELYVVREKATGKFFKVRNWMAFKTVKMLKMYFSLAMYASDDNKREDAFDSQDKYEIVELISGNIYVEEKKKGKKK